jgi:hypothetical protein
MFLLDQFAEKQIHEHTGLRRRSGSALPTTKSETEATLGQYHLHTVFCQTRRFLPVRIRRHSTAQLPVDQPAIAGSS